ncbi:hypothetical protein ACFVS2_13830 [Brevibacillus sp. NPDC058079]|uniref:hypothetical protein n=1 Tax=Brevibacillus sp. NPDC058079 TaxID=3346330 RepID=UPI0036E67D21
MSTNFDEIMTLIYSIESHTCTASDQEIIQKIHSWIPSYTCPTAAEGYFMVVSTVLHFRPQLEEELLKIAIEPLYYWGLDNAQDILSWIKQYQFSKGGYRPRKNGLQWLSKANSKVEQIDKTLRYLKDLE